MAYQQLTEVLPCAMTDRVTAMEVDLTAKEVAGLHGTVFYAGNFVPATLTTGTDTVGVAANVWLSEVRIGGNCLLTGIAILLGSVGGTDNVIVALFDANGNVLATSALAGTLAGTLGTFQKIPFTATFQAGPGKYYIGVYTNGTTARIRTQAAGVHGAAAVGSQTFGTVVAVPNPPTTFTAAQGPIASTY